MDPAHGDEQKDIYPSYSFPWIMVASQSGENYCWTASKQIVASWQLKYLDLDSPKMVYVVKIFLVDSQKYISCK